MGYVSKDVPLVVMGGLWQKEYEGPDYGYDEIKGIEKDGDYEFLEFPSKTELKFDAFLDGSMRLYWIGNVAKSGTPLFYACVSVAVLYRGPDKMLRNTSYTRSVNLLIFPFKTYEETFPVDFGYYLREFLKKLTGELRAFGQSVYTEEEVRNMIEGGKTLESVFGNRNVWIICDTSFSGITAQSGVRLITDRELGRFTEVKNKARARTRHYMRLLEFFALKAFKERNPNSLLMVDGLYPEKRHVQRPFAMSEEDYKKITNGVVGFIKKPMDLPLDDVKEIYEFWEQLGPGKALRWKGKLVKESQEEENKLIEAFDFALMRFRHFPGLEITPAGVVKVQAQHELDEEYFRQLLSAVYRERLPYVGTSKRSLNEPYPIEQAEVVAKSFFPSEERIRGLLSRVIPQVPYL